MFKENRAEPTTGFPFESYDVDTDCVDEVERPTSSALTLYVPGANPLME